MALNFEKGFVISDRFVVERVLGKGWEGEVYSVREISTGIERAAKIFYPQRNKNNSVAKSYAKKLHKLRHCSVLIHYMTQEKINVEGKEYSLLISEYVDGETLNTFLLRQKGKRLHPYQALHLLHALAKGVEEIHIAKEYHGDLHTDNVIIQRYGLQFDLKIIDMFNWGAATSRAIKDDVCDLVRILYDSVGGAKNYSQQPKVIKDICCGLKRSLINQKFKNAGDLRMYIENIVWEG